MHGRLSRTSNLLHLRQCSKWLLLQSPSVGSQQDLCLCSWQLIQGMHRRQQQPFEVEVYASMPCANLRIYNQVLTCQSQKRLTYLRVICHRKLLCGEKTLSGRNIMHRVNAASRIESGYLDARKLVKRLCVLLTGLSDRRPRRRTSLKLNLWRILWPSSKTWARSHHRFPDDLIGLYA